MHDVTIRPATPRDEPALMAIDQATWSADTSPAPRPELGAPFFTGDRTADATFVAVVDELVGGYVLVGEGYPMPAHAHVAHIRGLAVSPDLHGRGIGRRLLEHALGELGRRGITRISSHVLATNTASLAVHRRCGFVEEGRLVGEFVIDGIGPVDDVLLAYRFDSPPAP